MFRVFRFAAPKHRGLFLLAAVGLFWALADSAFEFALPTFLEKVANGNLFLVGVMLTLPSVAAVMLDVSIGELADRMSKRALIAWGLALMALVALPLLFFTDFWAVLLILAFWGVPFSVFYITMLSYLMDISPKKEASEYSGVYDTIDSVGWAIGPLVAGGFLMAFSHSAVFIFYSVSLALLAVGAFFLLKDVTRHPDGFWRGVKRVIKDDGFFGAGLSAFRGLGPTGYFVAFFSFFAAAWWQMALMAVPLYYLLLGYDAALGGLLMSAFMVPYFLFSTVNGIAADRYGRKKIAALGFLIAAFFSLALVLVPDAWAKIVCAFLLSTGMSMTYPAIDGIVVNLMKGNVSGKLSGVKMGARDVGFASGALITGALMTVNVSLPFVFGAAGFLALAGMLVFVKEKQ
jgi:MFS family permease